jgi:rRNA maturation protein Nop10
MEKHTVCEKCGSYTHEWNENPQHGFIGFEPCPDMTNESIKEKLIEYFKVFQEHSKRDSKTKSIAQLSINKAKKEREFWKGRFYTMKEENNNLRKSYAIWVKNWGK